MNRLNGFAVVVCVLLLSSPMKGQEWVVCSQGYCGVLTPAGSCSSTLGMTFEEATKSCPGTGCISLPNNNFACNDGTENGGVVKETEPSSNLAEWYRVRSGGTSWLEAMLHPCVNNCTCIVSAGQFACLKRKECRCELDEAAQQQKCQANEMAAWVDFFWIPDFVGNGACGTVY